MLHLGKCLVNAGKLRCTSNKIYLKVTSNCFWVEVDDDKFEHFKFTFMRGLQAKTLRIPGMGDGDVVLFTAVHKLTIRSNEAQAARLPVLCLQLPLRLV